jgi:hypothetical protein
MSQRSVEHAAFALERTYDASPDRVFAAWADPEAKARWFDDSETEVVEHNFRVGAVALPANRPGAYAEPLVGGGDSSQLPGKQVRRRTADASLPRPTPAGERIGCRQDYTQDGTLSTVEPAKQGAIARSSSAGRSYCLSVQAPLSSSAQLRSVVLVCEVESSRVSEP